MSGGEYVGDGEGLIIVMRAGVVDENGRLIEGVIADVRWCNVQFGSYDAPHEVDFTDQETAWGELEARQHELSFAAVIAYDEDGEVAVWGDPRFCDVAWHMVALVDERCGEDAECEYIGGVGAMTQEDIAAIERDAGCGVSQEGLGKETSQTNGGQPAHRRFARALLKRWLGGWAKS